MKEKLGPETSEVIGSQVPSASVSGSVAVTQSTILRSPVVVFCSAGWPRSMPESRMPMVTPRPSASGWSSTKSTAPVSKAGWYGFFAGVRASGPGYFRSLASERAPCAASARGVGSGSGTSCLRSMPWTEASFLASSMAASALAVGTVART